MAVAVAVVVAFLAFALGLEGRGDRSGGTTSGAIAPGPTIGADVGGGARAAAGSAAATPVPLASPDRPAAVGVRTATFTDTTRGTPARGRRPRSATRSLPVTIRYPTSGVASSDERTDAPPLGPAPLVVFGHGFLQSASRYAELLHDLASFGFVVVAPEFPMSSTVYDGAGDPEDVPEQARDVTFLITALTDPSVPTAGLIAPGPVGVMGQSDGAVTSLLVAFSPKYADRRVGAVVAVSGDWNTFGGNWYTTQSPPVVAVHGENDEVNPFYSSEWIVSHHPRSAMLVRVKGASHLGAVIGPTNSSAVARLAAFEFEWRLMDVPGAAEATRAQAKTPPLQLVVDHG